jgi:hypothetical protein
MIEAEALRYGGRRRGQRSFPVEEVSRHDRFQRFSRDFSGIHTILPRGSPIVAQLDIFRPQARLDVVTEPLGELQRWAPGVDQDQAVDTVGMCGGIRCASR